LVEKVKGDTTMHVRPVAGDDLAEWTRMRVALWPGLSPDTHEAEIAEIRANEATRPVFVVDRGNGLLGGFLEAGSRKFADGCETSPVGYIEGWYVDPDVRQCGWGGRLVEAAEAWARSCGYAEMASDCLLDNEISLKAHVSLGYAEAERLIHFRKSLSERQPPPRS
jgi:aminoglycoside 6'-N-acetyltransferase I